MATRAHLVRLFIAAAALLAAGHFGSPVAALGAALLLYLGAFAFTHDVAHGALRLPRRLNELMLSGGALVMGVAGHGMRLMHLRHHARPLAGDDVEGVGAALPFWKAVLAGPMNAARYRVEAFRAANARERRAMVIETLLTVGFTALALGSRTVVGAAWVTVNAVMQLTTAAWASNLPHNPPRWLKAVAAKLVWTNSPSVTSFLFHEEHHAKPKIPCAALAVSAC